MSLQPHSEVFDKRGCLSDLDFGFRKDNSTDYAIQTLKQFMHDALDKKVILATIFIDVKEAFDTICHAICHENYSIRRTGNYLIKSYFTGHSQLVDGGNATSSLLGITWPSQRSSMVQAWTFTLSFMLTQGAGRSWAKHPIRQRYGLHSVQC